MKIKILALAVVAALMWPASHANASIDIVPLPVSVKEGTGHFLINASVDVTYKASSPELESTAEVFSDYMKDIFGFGLNIKASSARKGAINLAIDKEMEQEEYVLEVLRDRVNVYGGSDRGVFYGLQTLRQLIPTTGGVNGGRVIAYFIPVVTIEDKPVFGYRGSMLDCCRHFFTVEEVKSYIDMIALHKINTFHWHLTDDQGWRIEIKKYPELINIGSNRKHTLLGHAGMPESQWKYDGIPYGGYYTQDQIREVVEYASQRYVTIIPEIEMPGHAMAALASYNWLGCLDNHKYEVWAGFGINDEAYCAGKETTFEFLENVLAEVLELFPSKYIHIGGDECRKVRWHECPLCQQRMKDNNLKDEHELQSYFVKRIENWVRAHGREIIGWNEILEGGISPTAAVMSWQGTKGGITAAKNGNYVVMTPTGFCYFDYYQSKDRDREPAAIGSYVPVDKVYSFDPYAGLNENERKFIMGVQGNLWTEYVTVFEQVQYMVLPRLAAMAEVGWSYDRKDYDSFVKRMGTFKHMYDLNGYRYAKHIFRPEGWYEPVTPGLRGSWK